MESYWFNGAAGDKVQGWLILPPGFDAAKTYPMVQLMHGGPNTMVRDSWSYRWNAHLFAATRVWSDPTAGCGLQGSGASR